MRHRHILALVVLLALCLGTLHAPAQLPDWSSLPVTAPGTVSLEQNLCVVPDGSAVHAWSGVSRQWTTMIASWTPAPVVNIRNEHCLVQDGPVFWGYSPRSTSFQAKFSLSGGAILVPIGSPQTWHDVIIDGNVVHAFFAISGHWESYTFPAPPVVSNGRFAFLISVGSETFAVSSFHGTLVPLGASSAAPALAAGNMMFAETPGFIHGFSASRNAWSSQAVFAPPAITTGNAQPGCARVDDGVQVMLFSGFTGDFTVIPATPLATVHLERAAAIIVDGLFVYGYSALLGASTSTIAASTPIAWIQQFQGFVDDGTGVLAYSAARNAFSVAYPVPITQVSASAQMAVAKDAAGEPLAVYSSFLNTWTPVPSLAPGVTIHLTAGSVVLEPVGGGLHANAMRSTNWVYQPTPPLNFATPGASPPQLAETFVAEAANTLYAFNPLTQSWASVQTAAPATVRRAHHHVILCGDGQNAYAFGHYNDRWAVLPVSGPLSSSNSNAQVQAAYVLDSGQLHTYSGVGQLSNMPEFPHYFRAATQGSLFRLDLAGEPGSPAVLAASLFPANIPLPPVGTLRLDPFSLIILAQPVLPSGGTFTLLMQIPIAPFLSGVDLHFQGAVLGSSWTYLTNAVTATVL